MEQGSRQSVMTHRIHLDCGGAEEPTFAEIDSSIQESLSAIEKAFQGPKGVKGGKRAVVTALTTIRAGVSELYIRAEESALTDAVGRLRKESKALRSEMAYLRKELEKLGRGDPKPHQNTQASSITVRGKTNKAAFSKKISLPDRDQFAAMLDRILDEVRKR